MPEDTSIDAAERAPKGAREALGVMFAAGVGGVLPTVAKTASTYVTDQGADLPKIGLYLAIGLFFVLGAAVAFMLRERDARKAMVLGIAAPGIVTNILAGATQADLARNGAPLAQVPTVATNADWGRLLGVSSAHAADLTPIHLAQLAAATARSRSQLTVVPAINGASVKYARTPVTLEFLSERGVVVATRTVDPRVTTNVSVPVGADTVRATSDGQSEETKLPRGAYTNADLHLKIDLDPGNDFLWALGGSRRARVANIGVSIGNVRAPHAAAREPAVRRGMEVVTSAGARVGVVAGVEEKPGRPAAVVVQPER